jgi:flagellar motor switch protein FliM
VSAEPVSYDFRSPGRLSREGLRALQVANEAFAHSLATVLANTLRAVPHASVVTVRQVTYEEYLRRLPKPSLFSVLSFDTLAGSGILQLPMGFAMSIIDRLLGGPGGPQQPIRALSDIETGLIHSLIRRIAGEITPAFAPIAQVQAEVTGLVSGNEFLQVVPPSEPVVVSEFEIRVGDQVATASLCLALATLQPVLAAFDHQAPSAGPGSRVASDLLERHLQRVEIDVSVAFRGVSLTSSEVFALAVGDIVPLRHPVADPLIVAADGVAVAVATPGTSGKRLACQIVSM